MNNVPAKCAMILSFAAVMGASALPPLAAPGKADAPSPRPPAFVKYCAECHETAPNAPESEGPNLWNLMSRTSGTAADFPDFSRGMKGANIVWTPATVDRYIEAPTATVPATTMDFRGLPDPALRKEITDFLATLHP